MNGKHFDIKDLKREYEKGFAEGANMAYDKVLNLLKLKIHSEDQQRHLIQKIIELKEEKRGVEKHE